MSKKVTLQIRYEISGMFSRKTFTADHVPLTCSKHTRSLVRKVVLWKIGIGTFIIIIINIIVILGLPFPAIVLRWLCHWQDVKIQLLTN